jgi:hypothetical protein
MLTGIEMRLARGISIAPRRTSRISITNYRPRALRPSQPFERAAWLRRGPALVHSNERGELTCDQ